MKTLSQPCRLSGLQLNATLTARCISSSSIYFIILLTLTFLPVLRGILRPLRRLLLPWQRCTTPPPPPPLLLFFFFPPRTTYQAGLRVRTQVWRHPINKMALKAMIVQLIVALVSVNFSLSARIAGFSPTYSGSHYFTIKKVMEELSARGHEVRSRAALQKYLWPTGKISAQPHPTLCIQFLNRGNNDKNNTFPLGKQICFTIVWGCAETLPLFALVVLHVGVHNYLEFSIVQKESVTVMLDFRPCRPRFVQWSISTVTARETMTNSWIFLRNFFVQIFAVIFQIQITDIIKITTQ